MKIINEAIIARETTEPKKEQQHLPWMDEDKLTDLILSCLPGKNARREKKKDVSFT